MAGSLFRAIFGIAGVIWLITLFFSAIALAALSLSAIQLRDQLDNDGKGEVSFSEVKDAQRKFATLIDSLDRRLNQQYANLEEEVVELEAQIDAQADILQGYFTDPTPITDEFRGIGYQNFPNFIRLTAECATNRPGEPSQLFEMCKSADALSALINEFKKKWLILPEEWMKLENSYFDARQQIKAAQPLYKHFNNLGFFEITRSADLLTLPREVLVLLLTMAMGLLGSVVTMTWSFVRRDSGMTLQRFAVLPIVGMTTAFVVLVFISAGQMTLTAGASGALNPFALSFIGIISGLLSERAYARLSDVGNNFFATADAQLRWANHLKEAMEADSVGTQEIARHLGLAEEDVERIVTESVPATLDQQRLIAACMRRPLRDLFTDAPPPDAASEKAPSVVAPYLIGLDEKEAERGLRQSGLRLGTVTTRPDDQTAPGAVLLQSPKGGALIARSSKVDVTVSTGPAASAPGDDPAPAGENSGVQQQG